MLKRRSESLAAGGGGFITCVSGLFHAASIVFLNKGIISSAATLVQTLELIITPRLPTFSWKEFYFSLFRLPAIIAYT